MPSQIGGIFVMGFIQGEARGQGTLFPVMLDELIPSDHMCRVIEAFVDGLDMAALGFERAEAAETERLGYDPRSAEAISIRLLATDPLVAAAGA